MQGLVKACMLGCQCFRDSCQKELTRGADWAFKGLQHPVLQHDGTFVLLNKHPCIHSKNNVK